MLVIVGSNKTGNQQRKFLEMKPLVKFQISKKKKNYNSVWLLTTKLDLHQHQNPRRFILLNTKIVSPKAVAILNYQSCMAENSQTHSCETFLFFITLVSNKINSFFPHF